MTARVYVHTCSHPLSSMVFGLNALVTKPAISFAPMITVALLSSYGYSSTPLAALGVSTTTTTAAVTEVQQTLTNAMFYTTCAVPVVMGLLQLVIWRFYTIRDSHKTNYMITIVS